MKMTVFVVVALTLVLFGSCSAPGGLSSPGGGFSSASSTPRPRVMLSARDVAALRAKAEDPRGRALRDRIIHFADEIMDQTYSETHDMGSLRIYGDELILISLAYLLTDETAYAEKAVSMALEIASFADWHDQESHIGLGHAHLTHGCAIAYDWCYGVFSEAQRREFLDGFVPRVEELYQAFDGPEEDRYWWSRAYIQNHMWNHVSSLGVAALAIRGDLPKWSTYYDTAYGRVEEILAVWSEQTDGANHEGPSYQQYGLRAIVPFLWAIRHERGENLVAGHPYFEAIPDWLAAGHSTADPHNFVLRWGDVGWDGTSAVGMSGRFLAAMTGDGLAEWLAQQVQEDDGATWNTRTIAMEYLFFDPTVDAVHPSSRVGDTYFADRFDAAVLRGGWEADDLIFAIKAGPMGGEGIFQAYTVDRYPWDQWGSNYSMGHDHWDQGGFILMGRGERLAPEAWSSTNKKAIYGSTAYHNTILVNGTGQWQESNYRIVSEPGFADHAAHIESVTSGTNYALAVADVAAAYDATVLTTFMRYAVLVRDRYVLIMDRLEAPSSSTFSWVCHHEAGTAQSIGDPWLELPSAATDTFLAVAVLSPSYSSVDVSTGTHEVLHHGEYGAMPYVEVAAPAAASTTFVMLLYPATDAEWSADPPDAALTRLDATGCTVQVSTSGGTDAVSLSFSGTATVTSTP